MKRRRDRPRPDQQNSDRVRIPVGPVNILADEFHAVLLSSSADPRG